MTKIALVSDLHLRHWIDNDNLTYPVDSVIESLRKEKPDVYLDAGDFEIDYYDQLQKSFPNMRIGYVPGNHDYYGKIWRNYYWTTSCHKLDYCGLNIGMATFWGDFNKHDRETMRIYEACLADCWAIKNFNSVEAYECHMKHRMWLETEHQNKPFDIIVTHHTPTLKAVHPRYLREELDRKVSFGFSSDLDDLVLKLKPKIWHFGHTHDPYDFMLGETRMINNPCGYPSEGSRLRLYQKYEPYYVEL